MEKKLKKRNRGEKKGGGGGGERIPGGMLSSYAIN